MKERGYLGYQIFPDRFFSSSRKTNTLEWTVPITAKPMGAHQKDFYGGDLKGIAEKADYIKNLGISFLYMTPVFKASTNHRYDCSDFFEIDPVLGTEEDLKRLIEMLHRKGIRLCLDGVFNHIGKDHEWYRNEKYSSFMMKKNGKTTMWGGHDGLPELNLENEELREILWKGENSVVRKWTNIGVDDWRLDCAYDVGYRYCKELTSVLKQMGDHNSIGEIWSYPKRWISDGVLDGVMNYYFRELIKLFLEEKIDGLLLSSMVKKTVSDCGLIPILKSWNMMSSHDTPRLKRAFGKFWKVAAVLQFTLPGSPLVYYGEELGLESEGDPYCRTPMPWGLTESENSDSKFYKELISLYNSCPALNSGDFGKLEHSDKNLFAFSRYTEEIKDFMTVVVNTGTEKKEFRLISDESSLMNGSYMIDVFTGKKALINNSVLSGSIDPQTFMIFKLELKEGGYSPYKRL